MDALVCKQLGDDPSHTNTNMGAGTAPDKF